MGSRTVLVLLLCFGCVGAWANIDRPTPDRGPTEVRITAYVLDVDAIDSAEQSFTLPFYFEVRWRDPRLAHDGPGPISQGAGQIWYPQIKIANQQRVWRTFDRIAQVYPDGEVVGRQRLWGDFSQPLDLADFPFDRHVFGIQIVGAGYSPDEVMFIRDPDHRSGIAEKLSVADWHISNYRLHTVPYEPIPGDETQSGFLISFEGERRAGHYLIKVILPLILIVAMSWVVFWIDPSEGGSQIGVALTTMLTLIAYRFAVGSELPNIPYLTRMDYFLLASTVLVFATLIEVVITSHYARSGRIQQAHRIDLWARWVFPAVFVFLTLHAFIF